MPMSAPRELTLGFSPCPNDTFIFHGLVSGAVTLPGCSLQARIHDVETLNCMAQASALDVSKLSIYGWLKVRHAYRLLATGGALGHGCGPILVARRALTRDDMPHCRIVLPGEWTTAHLLLRLWAPEAGRRIFTTYDGILAAVAGGQADCGVIIHETRFTFAALGFQPVVDLGAWWEETTGLPIPLGGVAAADRLPAPLVAEIEAGVAASIRHGRANPGQSLPFIRQHARELAPDVLERHIETFVNDYSLDLGDRGREAIARLEQMALDAGALE
jgi:1,4-dihydroxy-6-naphthoate synthase